MFTGIISETGTIRKTESLPGARQLQISASFAGDTHEDESISVNGVCLTVVRFTDEHFTVQCVEETLRKTTLGELSEGDVVNLERSLTLERAIEGHIVQGHVDTVGTIESIEENENDRLVMISFPEDHELYVVGRGSIAVDGISLTVAREEGNRFSAAIIPYTWDHTNLKGKRRGDRVNLEFDIFGKYIVKYLERQFPGRG